MPKIDGFNLIIKFQLTIDCADTEPDHYLSHYHGEIFGSLEDEEDEMIGAEPDIKLGEINAFLVPAGRIANDGESLFEAMDAASSTTLECYEAVIDQNTDDWKDEVRTLIGEDRAILSDILLIESLKIEEQYRGQGIGRTVAEKVIKVLGDQCAVIACKPFPLQYTGYLSPEYAEQRAMQDYEAKRHTAFQKVALFWSEQGFTKLASSDIYVLSEE
jgi:GNAT superfamily N-acetyltransferase